MNIQIKSSSGISLVPLESRLMADRKIFIEGEISNESACGFVKSVLYLNSEDSSRPIDVLVNCYGGDINAGLLMYDVIQSSKAPIRLFCIGHAYSMSAVLIASGGHGRYILPNSEMMIHEPRIECAGGNSSTIKSVSDSLLEYKRKMNEILVKHTGRTEEEIEQATSYDHYLSPSESVRLGLCDAVVGFDKIGEECMK